MSDLNFKEKNIINTLYSAQKPLTTRQVAKNSDMSWGTARKYLFQLRDKDVVCGGKKGKSTYWWLITE